LKPAAFALRRVGFGRLGVHGRIIRRGVPPDQGILAAGRDVNDFEVCQDKND
jgi:hypothetical protein